MERKHHGDAGEVIPWNAGKKDIQEEVNRRTAKAGYTTKHGERRSASRIMTTVSFGKVKYNIWPRDENGNLIDD